MNVILNFFSVLIILCKLYYICIYFLYILFVRQIYMFKIHIQKLPAKMGKKQVIWFKMWLQQCDQWAVTYKKKILVKPMFFRLPLEKLFSLPLWTLLTLLVQCISASCFYSFKLRGQVTWIRKYCFWKTVDKEKPSNDKANKNVG